MALAKEPFGTFDRDWRRARQGTMKHYNCRKKEPGRGKGTKMEQAEEGEEGQKEKLFKVCFCAHQCSCG